MVDLCEVGNVEEAFTVNQRPGDRVVGAAVPLAKLFREYT